LTIRWPGNGSAISRIVRELGRGGDGRRLRVRPDRLTPRAVDRFRREADGLHHTNIVPVYATGEEGIRLPNRKTWRNGTHG
jgi:hypothetical protein